jgi:hypothetical protein
VANNTPLQNIFVVARNVNNETIPMNPPYPPLEKGERWEFEVGKNDVK